MSQPPAFSAKPSPDTATPFLPGNPPTFELQRNGLVVLQGSGTDPIQATPTYNNYYYLTGDMLAARSDRGGDK